MLNTVLCSSSNGSISLIPTSKHSSSFRNFSRNPQGIDPNPNKIEIPLVKNQIPLLSVQSVVRIQTKSEPSESDDNRLSQENDCKDDKE